MVKFNLSDIYLFKWDILYYFELENEIGIAAFKMINTNQEINFNEIKEKFESDIKNDKTLNSLSPQDQSSYYRQIFEREEMAIQELKRLQMNSLMLSLYSFFEGRLKSTCDLIEEYFDFRIRLKDLNNNDDIMKYWNYLEKVFELDITTITTLFTPIKQHKIVRNKIAHQEGIISEQQSGKILIREGLKLNKQGERFKIIIEKAYISFLIEQIDVFLKHLLLAIDKKFKDLT